MASETTDPRCRICRSPYSRHTGPEKFCAVYATYYPETTVEVECTRLRAQVRRMQAALEEIITIVPPESRAMDVACGALIVEEEATND